MRIRILRPLTGLYAGRDIAGQLPAPYVVVDADDALALALIEAGDAEPVREAPVETATAPGPPENAAKRTGRTKTRRVRRANGNAS